MPAPKGNKNAVGNKGGGRPPRYKAEYARIAGRMAALGATDIQIAEALSVSEKTVNNWKKKYVEFCTAIKAGKDNPNANVERSLYRRAMGYEYIEVEKQLDEHGKAEKTKVVKKQMAPNVTAQIFYLKNRVPDRWRDQQEHNVTGTVNLNIVYDEVLDGE